MTRELELIALVLIAFVVSGIIAFAMTPLVKRFARVIGAIDVPKDNRRMHKKPIPRLGGLAIYLGFMISVFLFADINAEFTGILIGATIIVILGIIDDCRPLSAKLKFIIQIVAAAVPVAFGLSIEFFTNPNIFSDTLYIDLGFFSIPITILWIVGITNSVNLIDGLDGLAVGVSSISSFTLLAIALLVGEPYVAVIVAALTGACIGFMPYNLNPATIFMGDTGATFLGYILATVSILGLFKFYAIVSFAIPFLILGLPIFDTAFAIIRRVLSGRSPMSPDRGHVHHRLIDMGFNQKQAVAILYTISGVLGLSAVVLTTSGEIRAIFLLAAIIVGIAIVSKVIFTISNSDLDDDDNDK